MIHFHYIGYFDPRSPLDTSTKPYCPMPIRQLTSGTVERLAAPFGILIGEQVDLIDGYLVSDLGTCGQLHPFEAALVAEGCVVLSETGVVLHPPEAVTAWDACHIEPLTR